jgi:lysophospholipid acyltransferase (LPLAT)-like uncharacterized protein
MWAGSLAGALVIKILNRSCRVSVVGGRFDPLFPAGDEDGVPIYVAWHQRMFAYFEYLGNRHVAVMISRSWDGEIVSRAAAHLGFRPIRGSSTRGGTGALRELLDVLGQGRPVGFLADGPKGPARTAKMGPVASGRHRGDPIIPLAWNADRKWVLKSWDRYYIPKPFSRVVLYIGAPIRVPPGAGRETLEEKRRELEKALDRLCREADRHFPLPRKAGSACGRIGPHL